MLGEVPGASWEGSFSEVLLEPLVEKGGRNNCVPKELCWGGAGCQAVGEGLCVRGGFGGGGVFCPLWGVRLAGGYVSGGAGGGIGGGAGQYVKWGRLCWWRGRECNNKKSVGGRVVWL